MTASEASAPLSVERSNSPVTIAVCCLVIIVSLVLGVGLASHTILRHLIQTVPLWVGVVMGFCHSRATAWAALPLYLFWLLIVSLIWAYLLGLSRILTGHFSPVEIAMTIIVGVMAVVGIGSFVRYKSGLSPVIAGIWLVGMAVLQILCMWISLLPAVSKR